MSPRVRPGLPALLLAVWAAAVPARASDLSRRLDDAVQRFVDLNRFSGSVLVAIDGEPVLSKGYGSAHLEFDVPNRPNTRFNIGSLAKQFTAAAVLLLEADGALSLDDPLSVHLPDYPRPQADRILVRHLLTHQSGIPSLGRRDGIPDYEIGTALLEPVHPDSLVALFATRELQFTPGSEFRYNNSAYTLAARLVEAVSGKPFAVFARERLLRPAGLQDTGHLVSHAVVRNLATPYVGYPPHCERAASFDPSWELGNGGMYSTVPDLLKWNEALHDGTVLPPGALQKFLSPQVMREGRSDYGFGWFFSTVNDRMARHHGGTTNGFVTAYFDFPEDRIFIAALANLQPELGVDIPDQLGSVLSSIVLGGDPPLPPRVAPVAAEVLQRLAGEYRFDAEHTVRVWASDGTLWADTGAQGNWSLVTLARAQRLEATPLAERAARIARGLIQNDYPTVAAALREDRKEAVGPERVRGFADRLRQRWGDLESVTPHFVDQSPTEVIVMLRARFQNGAIYFHIEMEPTGDFFGWYTDETLPRRVPLLPTSDTTFFVDVFPHRGPGDPDILEIEFLDGDPPALKVRDASGDLVAFRS